MTAPNDVDYDYLPVASGSELSMGDDIVFAFGLQFVVDEISSDANSAGGTRYVFANTTTLLETSVDYPDAGLMPYRTTQYVVTLHPPVGTKFTNTGDGSRWVFQASETYRCFVGGSTYPQGTVLTRALIVGSMAEEPS